MLRGALPISVSKLLLALWKGSEGESGQPGSRGAGLRMVTFPLVCLLGMEKKVALFPKCVAARFPMSVSTVKITCKVKHRKKSITLPISSFSHGFIFGDAACCHLLLDCVDFNGVN